MQKITLEMPVVSVCTISNCAYNDTQKCHAKAITIGDLGSPECDTFLESGQHNHEKLRMAGVGACKITSCRHNDDYECTAERIEVGFKDNQINCLTFDPSKQ